MASDAPTGHLVHLAWAVGQPGHHALCQLGQNCKEGQDRSCHAANLRSSYERVGLWEACDPTHRICLPGHLCTVSGEKSCARILFLAKQQHAYGGCETWSGAEHIHCPSITVEEREWLFPNCSSCGVLTEARALILIHHRMLYQAALDGLVTSADIRCLRKSMEGYKRAFEVRKQMHVEELNEDLETAHDMEMSYLGGLDRDSLALGNLVEVPDAWWKMVLLGLARNWGRTCCGV